MNIDGAGIVARGITARGPEGTVFENVHARVDPGDLVAVTGPSGSGRTSLLLALSGRLRLITGHLTVSGLTLPAQGKAVRRLMAPARLRPGFELERRMTVRETVTERRITTGITRNDVEEAFALVGIDPKPDTLVHELHPGEQLLLAVALGAARAPAGLLVDDVELGLPQAARKRAWTALRTVARTGMTVVAGSSDPPGPDPGTTVIRLPTPGGTEPETVEHRVVEGVDQNTTEQFTVVDATPSDARQDTRETTLTFGELPDEPDSEQGEDSR
ncbi:ABC transporter family protein [Halopolyspora algeriensis]|uniref:ABC transporter family protein n=1 Tax=Halopolyspora algeriensis TaxID=1500506 RepID=A0A368VKG6_9ACTN|nr:ATP-binding cassette domain-containing protein [Halopolyspora algeriensis]RCW40153.1 ABC transporter family protein [Halopolyspora algeriensis]TQM46365.1 ABC transporter family protein [Halopolyspora algeriensis]